MEGNTIAARPLLQGRMSGSGRLVVVALAAGLVIVTRGTYDLSRLHPLLPLPLWLFFFFSLGPDSGQRPVSV